VPIRIRVDTGQKLICIYMDMDICLCTMKVNDATLFCIKPTNKEVYTEKRGRRCRLHTTVPQFCYSPAVSIVKDVFHLRLLGYSLLASRWHVPRTRRKVQHEGIIVAHVRDVACVGDPGNDRIIRIQHGHDIAHDRPSAFQRRWR
jgi:hypothetical protein